MQNNTSFRDEQDERPLTIEEDGRDQQGEEQPHDVTFLRYATSPSRSPAGR